MKTFADIRDWVGLVGGAPQDAERRMARRSFLAAIGNAQLVRQLVAIPRERFNAAAAAWQVEVEVPEQSRRLSHIPWQLNRSKSVLSIRCYAIITVGRVLALHAMASFRGVAVGAGLGGGGGGGGGRP